MTTESSNYMSPFEWAIHQAWVAITDTSNQFIEVSREDYERLQAADPDLSPTKRAEVLFRGAYLRVSDTLSKGTIRVVQEFKYED